MTHAQRGSYGPWPIGKRKSDFNPGAKSAEASLEMTSLLLGSRRLV
jgi:hypothetical protein